MAEGKSKKEGFQAAQDNVAQQAKLLDSAGTAWHAVKYGNLEMITKLFPSKCNVYEKGPVGDNVFHIAMLLNTPSTLAIARYLVKLYGKTLVNTPYQERSKEDDPAGLYEGETALHIAIVNRDFDMVKFLIQNGAEVRVRAYGGFFNPGSPVYYGEYPMSFAACTGQKDIVSYMKRHGARVNADRDMQGNTALHMCVYHNQIEMFDHLLEYCGATDSVRNIEGFTPLVLAASLGLSDMFQHICNKRRKVGWSYGPITSYNLSMREIDTVQNPGEYVPSAVEIIIRKGHAEMLLDPLVVTVLDTKWQRFASLQYHFHALAYLLFILVQVFLIWLRADTTYTNHTSRAVLEYISLFFAIVFIIVEAMDAVHWIMGSYHIRRLARAAAKYRPPLYAIPGYNIEPASKSKTKPGQKGQPVGEALELCTAAVSPGVESSEITAIEMCSPGWHQPDLEQGRRQRPVAEGQETDFNASTGLSAGSWIAGTDIVSIGMSNMEAPPAVTSMLSTFKKSSSSAGGMKATKQHNALEQAVISAAPDRRSSTDDLEADEAAGHQEANRVRHRGRGPAEPPANQLRRGDTFNSMDSAGGGGDNDDGRPRSHRTRKTNPRMRAVADAARQFTSDLSKEPLCSALMIHQLMTIVHFITWQACSRNACTKQGSKEFDDIVVAIVGLSGWLALLVHSRGYRWIGQAVIIVEACLQHVLRFCALFIPMDIGFTMAFYALYHGSSEMDVRTQVPHAFFNIGTGMLQLVRFMYGEASYEQYTNTPIISKKVIGTILFLLYIALVLLLLLNLLTAMVVTAFKPSSAAALCQWRLRWASYVLQAEKRLPWWIQQRHRLGVAGFDPQLKMRVWSHVYEVVEDSAPEEKDREEQLKVLSSLLDKLRAGSKK